MAPTELIVAFAVLIAVYQLWVSIQLVRSPIYEPTQKMWQLVLVWAVPIFGAVIVQTIMRSEGKPPYKPEKGYTEPGDSAS